MLKISTKLKLTFLVICFYSFLGSLFSQSCANYTATRSTGITYSSISSSGTSIPAWRRTTGSLSNQQDDNRSYPVPIGFDFWYLGVRYNYVSVCINGFLDFSSSTADGNAGATGCGATEYRENPDAFTCNTNGTYLALAPMYDDIWANGGGTNPLASSIKYQTSGTAPNRVFTVEWINMDGWCASCPGFVGGGSLNFQVQLYETTGNIYFNYGTMNPGSNTWAYALGINGPTISATPTPAQLLHQTVANSSTFSNSPETTNLATLPASNSRIIFNPVTPANPGSTLTFSGVTSSSMTLNWTDWATNELGYVIYMSDDGGTTYNFYTQTAANATSYSAINLSSGTTYHWKVYAVTEGQLSNALTGSQATLPKGPVISITTGLWSNPSTWNCSCVPTINDDVIIADATAVTLDMDGGADDLTVGQGTSGILVVGNSATSRKLTVRGNVLIQSGASFRSDNVNVATHNLWIKGNITNNGTLNFNPGSGSVTNSTFFRTGNQTISGSGSITNFGQISVKLDTVNANPYTLEVTSTNFTASNGFLNLKYGTFKFSSPGTNTIAPFSGAASYSAFAGFWLNSANATVNTTGGSLTYYGPLTVSSGTLNIGAAADQNLTCGGSTFTFSSGTINIAGRFDRVNGVNLTNFNMSGGTLNINLQGSTTASMAPFMLDVNGSSFNWTGGTIMIRRSGAGNLGFLNTGALTSYTVGTSPVLQIGDASTPAAQTVQINTNIPIANLEVNSTNSPTAILNTNPLVCNNSVTIGSGATFSANNLNVTVAGNWTNNSGTYTPGTNTTTFNGSSGQTVGGTTVTHGFNHVTVTKPTGQILGFGGSALNANINNFTINSGTVSAPTGTITITGNWTDNGTFTHNNGYVAFTPNAAQSISSTVNSSENYGWLIVNKSGNTLSTGGAINTINIANSLRMQNGTFTSPATVNITDSLRHTGGTLNYSTNYNISGNWLISGGTANQNACVITVGGNWTQNGGTKNVGTSTVIFNGSGSQQINGSVATQTFYNLFENKTSGSLLNTGGSLTTLTVSNNFSQYQGNFTAPTTMNVAGNFTHDEGTFNHNSGTVNFNGALNTIISSSGSITKQSFYNVTMAKSAAAQTVSCSGNITTLDVDNTITLTTGTFSASDSIFVGLNWSRATAAVHNHNNGIVIFDGSAAQAIGGTATTQVFYNINVNKTNTLTVSPTNFTVNNLNIFNGNYTTANNPTMAINGSFYMSASSGTYTNTGGGTTTLLGNFTRNGGTFTPNTQTLVFGSTTGQQRVKGITTNFYRITLNNTFGTSPQIVLDTAMNVSNTFTPTNGIMETNVTDILTLLAGASTTVGSSSSFVSGPMHYQKSTTATQTLNFPIGKGTSYNAVELTVNHTNTTSVTYRAESFNSSANALMWTLPLNVTHVSYVRYWDIERYLTSAIGVSDSSNLTRTGANSPRVRLYYNAADDVNGLSLPNLAVCKNKASNPTQWYDLGGNATGSPSGNIVTPANMANFTSFSRFTLANKVGGSHSLPMTLINFDAKPNDKRQVELIWSTASEANVSHFELERSSNAADFTKIAQKAAAGNSNSTNNYFDLDPNPLMGISYYRLKSVDINGSFQYSNIVRVYIETPKGILFPNPVSSVVNIEIPELEFASELNFELFNSYNQRVLKGVAAHKSNDKGFAINGLEFLPAANYILEVYSVDKKYTYKFIKQ